MLLECSADVLKAALNADLWARGLREDANRQAGEAQVALAVSSALLLRGLDRRLPLVLGSHVAEISVLDDEPVCSVPCVVLAWDYRLSLLENVGDPAVDEWSVDLAHTLLEERPVVEREVDFLLGVKLGRQGIDLGLLLQRE